MQPAYFAFLATLVALGHAGPIQMRGGRDQTTCAKTCTGSNKFGYKSGIVYQYEYAGTASIQIKKAFSDQPTISMRTKVEIEPVSKCEMIMRITEATLNNVEDASQSTRFQQALTEHSLRFAFQDGVISAICPESGESARILNIKRGILSAFQNSMDSFDSYTETYETDADGTCLTAYSLMGTNDNAIEFTKEKDLLSCSNREHYNNAMQSVMYNSHSEVNSLPLLKGSYKCHQKIDPSSMILKRSECKEEQVFRPFSNGDSGAMTAVTQTLVFTGIHKPGRAAEEGFSHRTTLIFEHEHNAVNQHEAKQEIQANLLDFCKNMDSSIGEGFTEKMNELIEYIKEADYDTLRKVYNTISRSSFCQKNSERTKKYFFDAIPMVGTTASVKLMHDLISKKQVTGTEAQVWLFSLSFIQHPTKEMIAAILPLLDIWEVADYTILPISALAGTYCDRNPNCGNDIEIENLIKKLLQFVGSCNNPDDMKMVLGLRALGSIGHSTKAVPSLSRWITKRKTPIALRVSAIEAFRYIPCDASRSDLMGVFGDTTEDSEIRISTYIALMRCPSDMIVDRIRLMLEREKSNQVGSFVWSHLTNLMETSDPHRQDIRSILEDEKLKKEFNLDNRKFSRNYEKSVYFETLNAGAAVESNVIFSEKSFVPRSANLNLTIDLFGHAINVLEFGGRVENADSLLEKLFSQYAMTKRPMKAGGEDKLDMLFFMRIFGKDVMVNKFNKNPMSMLGKPRTSLFKTMQFIDSKITVPTCMGLPLNLIVTTTGGLDYESKNGYEKAKFLAGFKLSAEFQVRSLMAVTAPFTKIGLKMLTTAHTSNDVQLKKEGEKINIKLPKKLEFLNIKTEFSTVHDRKTKVQPLITDDVHRINFCSGESLKVLTGLRFCQDIQYVNASSHKNAPYFPFTGPMKFNWYMKNEDAPNDYVIEAYSAGRDVRLSIDTPGSKTRRKTAFEKKGDKVSFYTPYRNIKAEGALTNSRSLKLLKGQFSSDNKMHKMFAQLEMEYTRTSLKFVPKFTLTSENKDLEAQARLEYVYKKRIDFNASYTGPMGPVFMKVSSQNLFKGMGVTCVLKAAKKEYSVIGRISKFPKKIGFKYSPSILVKENNIVKLDAQSELNYDGKSKVVGMFKLDKILANPIHTSFIAALNTGKNKNKQLFKLTAKTKCIISKINIEVEKRNAGILSRMLVSYASPSCKPKWSEQFLLTTKARVVKSKNAKIYYGSAVFSDKNNKNRGFTAKGKLTKTPGHYDVNGDFTYGNPKDKATNNVKFNAAVNYKIKPIAREFSFFVSAKSPKKINYQMNGTLFYTHIWPLRKVDISTAMQLSNKVSKAGIFYSNVKVKGLQKTEGKVSLDTPHRDMGIEVKIDQLTSSTYNSSASVQWQKGRSASIETMLKNTPQVSHIENTVKFPNNKNVKLIVTVNKSNNNYNGFSMLHADEGTLSNQKIDLKAKSKYNRNGADTTGEVNLELESDASKKFKFTASRHNTNGQKTTTEIDLTTPFEALKSYSDSIEQTVDNKQLSYRRKIQWRSNGNENDIQTDLNYNWAIQEFDCNYHSSINSIPTDMELLFKNSANKKSALFKVNHNKPNPLIFIKMDHARDRRQVTTDASLMFDMYNSNGNVKFAMQKDDREITFSGDVNVKISNHRLESTYSLKHNDAESSIKLNYTSNLHKNRNQGSISTVVTKNLPGNVKADVSVTLNNKPQLKMVVNSVWSKENVDVNVEVTDHNAKMIAGSFNLNLSGTRKTSHAEIKSDSTDITFSAAVDFQSDHNIDSELQMGYNGKNLLLSGNYKKESSNHKINANFGLPDGRQIKMQTSFNNAAKKSFSFNVESEDFMDMVFSVQQDNKNFMVDASVKVLPYLEKTQLKASLTRDKMLEASAELETPFESIKQAKAIVSLEIDGKKQDTINVKTFLNSKKFSSFKLVYNIRSLKDFSVKITVSTLHRKYNEFLFDITHRGDWMNFDSNVEMKAGNIFMLKSTWKNGQHNTDLDFSATVRDRTWVFQLVKSNSELTSNVTYKIRQKDQYTAHMKLNGKQGSLQLTAPGDKKFNADMTINPNDHVAKLDLKLSIPSDASELMLTFSGTLASFNFQADFTHNTDKYIVTVSNKDKLLEVTVATPLINSKMDLTKNGGWDMFTMNLEAKYHNIEKQLILSVVKDHKKINVDLSAPACEIQFHWDNNNIENGMVSISLKKFKFEVVYTDKDAKPKTLSLTFSTPKHNLVMKMSIDVKKNGIDGNVLTTYNEKKLNLDGSYKTVDQKKIFKGKMETPTSTYDLTGTLTGKLKKFKITIKLQHDKDAYELTMSNKAFKTLNLNMCAPGFKLKMDFEGELQKFKFFTSMNIGKKQFKGVISNENYWKGFNADITADLANFEMKWEFDSDMRKMLLSTQLQGKQNKYSLSSSINIDTHSYSLSIMLPWFILKANIMNGFQSSNMETKLVFSHGTYELTAFQDSNSFNMTATRQGKQKLDILVTKTSAMLRFQNKNDIHEYHFTFNKAGVSVNLSSFGNTAEGNVKFNDNMNEFSINAQLLNKGNTYKLEASNDKYKQIKFHTIMPNGKVLLFLFDNTGNSKDGKIRATVKYNKFNSELNLRWLDDKSNAVFRIELKASSEKTRAIFNYKLQFEPVMEILVTSLDITINNRKSSIISTIRLSNGVDGSIVLDDPYTGRAELTFKIKPWDMNNFKSNWVLNYNLTGNVTITYEHSLTETSFKSIGNLESGNNKLANYKMEVNFQDRNYGFKADLKNGKYNINCKGSFKDGQKDINIQVKTPYRYLRDVTFSAELYSNRMLKVSATFPRQFYAAKMDWKSDSLTTEIDLHMDRVDKLKQFKIILFYVNADERATVSRHTTFTLIQGDTVLTTKINWKKSHNMYMSKGEFSWGEADDQKVGAELRIKTAEKKEVSLILMSHHRNSVVTCSQESGRDRRNIMCALTPDASKKNNKIGINADIFNYDNKKIFDITIKLPNQKNSLKLKTVINGPNGDSLGSIRTQLSYDENVRKTLTIEAKMNNNNGNYTLNAYFEHPYSNLALEILAFATAPQHRYSTGVELKYLTSKRSQKSFKFFADIDKRRREMKIEAITPKNQLEIFGSAVRDNQFEVTLKKMENGMKDRQVTATISHDAKSWFFESSYDLDDPKKQLRMRAEMMNRKLMAKVIRVMGQQVNKDGRMSIELKPSSILLAQIFWNPDTVNELNDYCYAMLQHYGNEMKLLGDRIGEFLSKEISTKGKLMKESFNEPLDTITNFMSSEYDHFSNEVANHARRIGEFYERNSFYIKSALDLWDSMWVSFQREIENLWRYVENFNMRMMDKLDEAKMHMEYYYMYFQRQYLIYKAKMSRKIDEMFHYMQEQYNSALQHLHYLRQEIQMYINKFPAIVKRIRRQMKEYPFARTAIENGRKILNTLYQHMSSHPWTESFRNIGLKVYQQAEWAFNYWQVKDNLYSLKDKTVKHIRKELNMLADVFSNFNVRTLIFDPKNGEIVVEFYYKSLMMAYKYARSIKQVLTSINHVVSTYVDMLPDSYWSISDIYYTLKPYTSLRNWTPPSKFRASMIGSHIQTFDGSHLDYLGKCSHILAHSEGNFDVVANYSPKRKQLLSLTVTTGDNENLRILQNYGVLHNGRLRDLPFNIKDAKVFRTNDIITVLGDSGYTVDINPSAGFYAVTVSGWYFNRVSGLFGTNNNEQFDDMLTSTKQLSSDVEDLADSWMTNAPCRSENRADRHHVPNESICSFYFKETWSPFRSCFKQVNPEYFHSVCNSHTYVEGSGRKVICDLVDYYNSACNFRGVFFSKLPFCSE